MDKVTTVNPQRLFTNALIDKLENAGNLDDLTDDEYGKIVANVLFEDNVLAQKFTNLEKDIESDKNMYFKTRDKNENQVIDTISTIDKLNLKRVYDSITDVDKENKKKLDELLERYKTADKAILDFIYQFIQFQLEIDIEKDNLDKFNPEEFANKITEFKLDQVGQVIDDYMFDYSDSFYNTIYSQLDQYNQKIAYETLLNQHVSKRTAAINKKLVSAYNRIVYNTSSINDIIGVDRRFVQETNCGNTLSENPDVIACGSLHAFNFIAELENKHMSNLWVSCCDLHKKEIEVSDRFTILLEQETISSKFTVLYISTNRFIHQLVPHQMHFMIELSWSVIFSIFSMYKPNQQLSTRVFIELFKYQFDNFVACDGLQLELDGSISTVNGDYIGTVDIFALITDLHSYNDKITSITNIYEHCIPYI